MKNLKKILLLLGVLLGLFACSSLPTEEDNSSVKSSVKFTMQNIGATNSNILFSATDEQTPSKVAISYKKSGEGEAETSTTIELTAFGTSYITDDVLSLYEGNYELTKFDVLNDEGTTIYSTPVSGSEKAKDLNITTALAYGFEVKEGEISTEKMQVVAVTDTTDPADFGHAAFTFDKVNFSKFYIDVLVLDDSLGWVYTTAQVEVKNAENTKIKTASLDGKMNKVIVANSESYTITISKDGYTSQELSFTADSLETYKSEPLIVNLQKASRPENVDYVVALDGSGDFTSIQTAIEAAEAGSTIFVKNGIYEENISFEKNLNLIGENIEKTIVHGKNNGGLVYTNINSGSSLIKNFTFSNGGTGVNCLGSGYMILKNIIVKNNYLEDAWCYFTGICFGTNGIIENALVIKNEKKYFGVNGSGTGGIFISGDSDGVSNIELNHVTVADNISNNPGVPGSNFVVYQDTKVTINNSIVMGEYYEKQRTAVILNNTTTTGSGVVFKDDTTYQLSDESFGKNAASDGEDMGFVLPSE